MLYEPSSFFNAKKLERGNWPFRRTPDISCWTIMAVIITQLADCMLALATESKCADISMIR
jgi:hypothetical protein